MRPELDAAIFADYGRVPSIEIGARFGVSKNVIIGRARRLGLCQPKRPPKGRKTVPTIRLNIAPERTPTISRCCFIAKDVRDPEWRYCHEPTGNPAIDYCPEHRAIVWVKPNIEATRLKVMR